MHTTTLIPLSPSYKGNNINFALAILLAILMGPLIVFGMFYTAITNKITDPVSWTILGVSTALFCYLSYTKFKYIYYTYFKEHTAEIDYDKKNIFFQPYKETVSIEYTTAFIYSRKFKKYIFRYSNQAAVSIEAKRNTAFEHALLDFSLECKEE